MSYNDFMLDLIEAKKGEKIVYNFLEEKGLTYLHSNDDYKYDFEMLKDGEKVKYEVKTDGTQWLNHFVEFQSSSDYGKTYTDSGIRTSESDWYAFYYSAMGEIWFIRTKNLKILVENNVFEIKYQSKIASSPAKGYKIVRKDYKQHFNVQKL
jgi:hypothetical protein